MIRAACREYSRGDVPAGNPHTSSERVRLPPGGTRKTRIGWGAPGARAPGAPVAYGLPRRQSSAPPCHRIRACLGPAVERPARRGTPKDGDRRAGLMPDGPDRGRASAIPCRASDSAHPSLDTTRPCPGRRAPSDPDTLIERRAASQVGWVGSNGSSCPSLTSSERGTGLPQLRYIGEFAQPSWHRGRWLVQHGSEPRGGRVSGGAKARSSTPAMARGRSRPIQVTGRDDLST
jgi:hypothetical protein